MCSNQNNIPVGPSLATAQPEDDVDVEDEILDEEDDMEVLYSLHHFFDYV